MANEVADADVRILREMGLKEELYRGFSPFMSFAFCFTTVNVFTAISIAFTDSLNRGGSAVIIWCWIIGSIFTILVGLSLAELSSVYPTAGSVYYWVGQLVSVKYAPLVTFICGWFNFVGHLAGYAVWASGFAQLGTAAVTVATNNTLTKSAEVGLSIGLNLLWAVKNVLRIDQQGWMYNIGIFFHLASVVSVVIVLLAMAPARAKAYDVFTATYNGTGFSLPYVYSIGILSTVLTFRSYEAGAHLAEETKGASRSVPKVIVATCICSAVVGFAYLLALLFVIPDISSFVQSNTENDSAKNLAVAAYQLAVPHIGALVLTILLILNSYFAGMSSMTVTSRIGFAMARDGVFPFSKYVGWIMELTKAPIGNILLIFIIDSLILLLRFASETAFTAIVSIATIGYQISYFMPILFRCTTARNKFPVGVFNLGRLSLPIAVISAIWLFVTSIILLFPSKYPVTKDNMNYTVVMVAGIALFAGLYWLISARYWFIGPKRVTKISNQLSPKRKINRDSLTRTLSPTTMNVFI